MSPGRAPVLNSAAFEITKRAHPRLCWALPSSQAEAYIIQQRAGLQPHGLGALSLPLIAGGTLPKLTNLSVLWFLATPGGHTSYIVPARATMKIKCVHPRDGM